MQTLRTIKETLLSSLPLAAIILIVCVFVAPLQDASDYLKLGIGYFSVVVGQALFLVGLENSILPIGKMVGGSLAKFKKTASIIIFGFLFGLLATVAEPALAVLARQTHLIMPIIDTTLFVWIMGTGIGLGVGFSLYRIMKNISIKVIFAVLYLLLFAVIIFTPEEFIALAFDGSGATTGDISVPFILVLGVGVSATMSKRKTNDDTFGIIGIASFGPILTVLLYGIVLKTLGGGSLPEANVYDPGSTGTLGELVVSNLGAVALALLPILILFIPFQIFLIKLQKKDFAKILLGAIPVYAGLFIFLTGIDFGFAFAGEYIGRVFFDAARPEWFKWLLLLVGFVLGAAITLSEPAVTVLGTQLEEITNGHIKSATIRLTLALGIAVASLLAILKIITEINILFFLVPLYAVALIMMRWTPRLYVGLAFDSGGVTGGALTSAFLTPLTLGIAQAVALGAGANAQSVLTNGFGIIAFISVTPLIAVQLLGLIYEWQARKVQATLNAAELEGLDSLLLTSTESANESESEKDSWIGRALKRAQGRRKKLLGKVRKRAAKQRASKKRSDKKGKRT